MASQNTQYGLAQHTEYDFGITDPIYEAVAAGQSKVLLIMNPNYQLNEYDLNVIKSQLENITKDIVWGIAYEPQKHRLHAYHQPGAVATRTDAMLAHGTDAAATALVRKNAEGRVRRPRNSFMIYRMEKHAITVDQNPGMHNNDISKIIGEAWSNETPECKAKFARLAEEEKRQHAIDHPGYQYKPRKPSEKKRRMTKGKLAKLGNVMDNVRERQHLRKVFNPAPPTTGLTAAQYAAMPSQPNPYPVNLGGNATVQAVQATPTYDPNDRFQVETFFNILQYGAPVPVAAQPMPLSAAVNNMAAQYRQNSLADAEYNRAFNAMFDGPMWEKHQNRK